MRTTLVFGIISALFGAVSLSGAISGSLITAGGFGLAAGIMGLAAAIASTRKTDGNDR
ncbi:hypothetical protein KIH79_09225 [Bifidobacterium sp. 82T10]|uniref:Uncharacterized protein n=1 Tax=Bifidobacterium miconis TaxID=2834435 RepID=A0ABS6WIK0_9BIFI|nr:hypothetical protein [Bifidobacterium miconis]MBW3093097.1 hypothetical protein [Bifidobacterium miconis]